VLACRIGGFKSFLIDRKEQSMKCKFSIRIWSLFLLPAVMMLPLIKQLAAQPDKVAAFKQSLAQNQKRLQQYQWIETTIVSLKGEEKSRIQKQCHYGPDGKVQKQQISAPPEQQSKGGLRGRIVAKKKEEMTDYMQQAVALVHQYVPPDSDRIQAAKDAGKLSFSPLGQGAIRLDFHDFVKPGDSLSITLDASNLAIQKIDVKSYLDSQDDAVTLSVTFASLNDGVSYPANSVLTAPAKNIQVVVENVNYQKMVAVAQEPQQQAPQSAASQGPEAPQLSPQQIDSLTAPIALYPDALLAQILTGSTNFFELQSFAAWLAKNAALPGSALQDAAQKAGYDPCFVALAPFPQVVQMMTQKPDWTEQLGQLFAANRGAVFDSIQRLRAQALAAGNLKSTSQQQVQTQTTSSGQQVIVIQPANPQVIYVPQYNPQVVYVQAPPPTTSSSSAGVAAVAFTTGVIIGAAASNNYYYGPYGWHGAAMYNEAWDNRYDYANQRQDYYQQNASQRQSTAQANQAQRQSTSQANQAQRQSTSQANQAQRQSSAATAQSNAQTNQAQRQSSAATTQSNAQANQAQRQSSASTAQSNRQAQQGQRQSAASTSSFGTGQAAAQRSGMSSGGFSGYQGGAGARAESSRGNRSLSSSRSGGGGGRRR
jgi:hypothetical protein